MIIMNDFVFELFSEKVNATAKWNIFWATTSRLEQAYG